MFWVGLLCSPLILHSPLFSSRALQERAEAVPRWYQRVCSIKVMVEARQGVCFCVVLRCLIFIQLFLLCSVFPSRALQQRAVSVPHWRERVCGGG